MDNKVDFRLVGSLKHRHFFRLYILRSNPREVDFALHPFEVGKLSIGHELDLGVLIMSEFPVINVCHIATGKQHVLSEL